MKLCDLYHLSVYDLHFNYFKKTLFIFTLNMPTATLLRLLEAYDEPVPAPAIKDQTDLLKTVPTRHILAILKKDIAQLNATASAFNTSVQELNFTDCNYKDLVRVLYSNRQRQCNRLMQCTRMLSSTSCKGPRNVTISVSAPLLCCIKIIINIKSFV